MSYKRSPDDSAFHGICFRNNSVRVSMPPACPRLLTNVIINIYHKTNSLVSTTPEERVSMGIVY
jgi:hypothetical protein